MPTCLFLPKMWIKQWCCSQDALPESRPSTSRFQLDKFGCVKTIWLGGGREQSNETAIVQGYYCWSYRIPLRLRSFSLFVVGVKFWILFSRIFWAWAVPRCFPQASLKTPHLLVISSIMVWWFHNHLVSVLIIIPLVVGLYNTYWVFNMFLFTIQNSSNLGIQFISIRHGGFLK